MAVDRVHRSRCATLACAALTVAGCLGSSRPSRFYTLAPAEVRDPPAFTETSALLAIGPIDIPDYLDRQQIVTRAGEHELAISDFERWGGSLEREISRSLVATAADRLAARRIIVSPWRSMPPAPAAGVYRARITISRFEGAPGQSVVLRARWQLVREREGKEELLAVKEADLTEHVEGGDHQAVVAAMQRALLRFGAQMADGVAATTEVARAP